MARVSDEADDALRAAAISWKLTPGSVLAEVELSAHPLRPAIRKKKAK